MASLIDENKLRMFVPASSLKIKSFKELAAKTFIENVPAGKAIFKKGERDKQSVYLVDGQADILFDKGNSKLIIAGSDMAKHPLANHQPRKYPAVAKVDSKVIRIDTEELDTLLTWEQLSGIEVDEIQTEESDEYENDWMTRILQSKAFLKVPPANIQALFMRIQEVSAKAGKVIIKQGDAGDYYYLIKRGRCKVTRKSKTGSELILATLGSGDAFGEEALLSDAKRNANVIMVTNGVLMQLSKADFNELLKAPMLTWVTNKEAGALVKNKGAIWIDVRLESEYKNSRIKGSINIPLFMLRLKAQTLDPKKQYIIYCNTGRQSSACAFLLSERGFRVYCLKDGLVGWRGN